MAMAAAGAYPGDAASLLGAADRLRAATYPLEAALRPAYDTAVAQVTAAIGETGAASARASGRALPDEEVDSLVVGVAAALADL
jgi:hypothetical protein